MTLIWNVLLDFIKKNVLLESLNDGALLSSLQIIFLLFKKMINMSFIDYEINKKYYSSYIEDFSIN